MKFCDDCGSFLRKTREGLWCPKCKKSTGSEAKVRIASDKKRDSNAIYVVDKSTEDYVKISRSCPECGNQEVFRWFSRISGEHAGIGRERTVEHFRCTNCSHQWAESS